MSTTISLLHQMIRKLSGRAALDQEDEDAILALPHVIRSHHPATYVIREGEPPPKHCAFIRSGFAIRQKITAQGARQIVSLHLAGDFIDLENLFLSTRWSASSGAPWRSWCWPGRTSPGPCGSMPWSTPRSTGNG